MTMLTPVGSIEYMMTSQLNFVGILVSILLFYSCVQDTHGSTQYPPEFPTDQATGMYIDVYEDWKKGHYLRSINASDRNGDNISLSVANGETGELIYLKQTKFGSQAGAELYLNQALDRDHNPSIRTLKFKASDNIYERDTIIFASLNIRDVNDVTPMFNLPSYQFSISENTPPSNSKVFNKILVTDADTGLNQRFNMYMEPFSQSSSHFQDVFLIRQISNGEGNSTAEILLNKSLDYETLTFYQYVIKAVDQGHPPNTGTATLIIKVTDFQDTPPFFQSLLYMKEIKENVSPVYVVLRVQAEDGDRGVPNPIRYSFLNDGNCTDFFHMDSSTGVVTVAKAVDRDAGVIKNLNGVCRLTVKASEIQTNNAGGISTATTPMTITIQDVDDNKPMFEENTYWAEVRENLTNIPITIINHTGIGIKDIDQGLFSQFDLKIYKYSSPYSMLSPIPYSIISDGEIIIQLNNQPFDYEVERRIKFQVVAQEKTDPTHTSTCTVYMDIIDTNDNSPVFTKPSYNVTIHEGSDNSSHVVNLTATDADSGKYGHIHYELRNGGQLFVIDSKTGVIRTNCDPAELDFEKKNVYYLTVEALDGGGGRTPASVIINLRDVNDNPPAFISNSYEVTVKEGERHFSTNPFLIKATDNDEPGTNNSAIKYRLNIDDDLKSNFTINSTTGEISLNGTLDYEKIDFKKLGQQAGRIVFYAIAEDLGKPSLSSNATIVINVQDVNDNTQKFNQSLYNACIKEGKFETSTTTSPTSTQTIPLQERHDIVCGTSGISAVVPHSLFPGNPTVTWSDPSCSVQSNGSHFVASIGFHDCGTTVRFTTDTVIFENTLKSNGATTMNPVVDFGESSVYTIPIQCVYQRKENVTGSFFPIRQTTRYFEKRFGHLDLHMEKYTDDKFTRTLTNQRIPLGSDFFVKLTVDHLNRSDLAIKADNCVATPTSSPADSLFFRLLQDGCPSSSAVHLIQSAYNEVRFRMTSFIFRGTGTGLVYIHCEVSVCPASSTECSVGCLNRRKRAASNVHSSHLLSAGPILLVTDEGTPASVIVAAVCAAVAVVATVFAVIGWRRRRDFGKTDILH